MFITIGAVLGIIYGILRAMATEPEHEGGLAGILRYRGSMFIWGVAGAFVGNLVDYAVGAI